MKVKYNGSYCSKLEQYIQLSCCRGCQWCAFRDNKVYCAYPTCE